MKALSLWQPWATLLAAGIKRVESRDWLTHHEGALAIHATANIPQPYKDDAEYRVRSEPNFRDPLNRLGFYSLSDLPTASIVGVVLVTTEHRINGDRSRAQLAARYGVREMALGHYADGRIAIHCSAPILLRCPIPCRGERRLWTVPQNVLGQMREQLHTHEQYRFYRDAFPMDFTSSHTDDARRN